MDRRGCRLGLSSTIRIGCKGPALTTDHILLLVTGLLKVGFDTKINRRAIRVVSGIIIPCSLYRGLRLRCSRRSYTLSTFQYLQTCFLRKRKIHALNRLRTSSSVFMLYKQSPELLLSLWAVHTQGFLSISVRTLEQSLRALNGSLRSCTL